MPAELTVLPDARLRHTWHMCASAYRPITSLQAALAVHRPYALPPVGYRSSRSALVCILPVASASPDSAAREQKTRCTLTRNNIRQPARAARARTAAAVSGLCGGSAAARRVVQGWGLRARATQRYSPHDTHSSRRAGVRLARWATHALRDVQVLPKDRMSGDSPYVCFLLCTHRLQGFYLFCAITSHPQIFTPQLFTPHDTHFTGPRERPSLRTA